MCDWVCYLLMSLNTNQTYVGSTNNMEKRLSAHNNNNPDIKRVGAKKTRGQTWVPIVIVSGFHHKNACLSFESGFKRLCFRRSNQRLALINEMCGTDLRYTEDTKWNRIMDLLYFMHNVTLLDTKFRINYDIQHPVSQPNDMTITILIEEWIATLPWPHFVNCIC